MPLPSLPRTADGVCPIVCVILGRREVGKTTLLAAIARITAPREKLVIVSPIGTLHTREPDLAWFKVSASNKPEMEKIFRGFLDDGEQRVVLADEGDELTAANAAGTAGGFICQAVYDYINYGREQGLGIVISSRRPQNIAKDVCANANLVFIGQTTDPASLTYYDAWMSDPLHPDIDFKKKAQLVPPHVFIGWSPLTKSRFLGYFTVDEDGDLRQWDPSELRQEGAGDANDTDPSDTPGTAESDSETDFSESDARSAGAPSPTVPARHSARPISSPLGKRANASE